MIGDEIKPALPKVLTTHNTDVEIIVQHLQGKLKRSMLSDMIKEKIDRMHIISDLIRQYGSRLKVVPMIEQDMGISKSQALRLFNETIQVYSTVSAQEKGRDLWIDILLGQIMEGMKKSLLKQDFKAHASYVKTFKDTIVDLIGDAEAAKYDKVQPPPIVIGFFPELVMGNVTEEELLKAAQDFRRKKKENIQATDTNYESVD